MLGLSDLVLRVASGGLIVGLGAWSKLSCTVGAALAPKLAHPA